MNRYKTEDNRQQLSLMPMCLDDMVAPDNVVRAIDAIVVSRADIEAKIKGIQERHSELKNLESQIKESGSIYITDPDSRLMRMNNNGGDICHNVQIAVDDKNHLVVAVDVTSEPVDK
jgi:hypothetical protein